MGAPRRPAQAKVEEPGDQWEFEGKRLAGAGPAAAEDVLASHGVGDRRRLDREGVGDPVAGQPLDEPLGEVESREAVVRPDLDGTVGHRGAGSLRPGVGFEPLGLGLLERGRREPVAAGVALTP